MIYSNGSPLILHLLLCIFSICSIHLSAAHNPGLKGRGLKGIKETPIGGNVTYDCSPSGPCIPCSHPEKSDESYHCGETGYRIRLKCVPIGDRSKDAKNMKADKTRSTLEINDLGNQRRLLDDSSRSKGGPRPYVIYKSCIPAVSEERLSVLGFEALMLTMILSSGSFIYFRRKRRVPPTANTRF